MRTRRESTSFSSSAVPRMPPTNAMRVLVRGSSIPNSGANTRVWSSETSSKSMADPALVNSGRNTNPYHLPAR